MKNQVNNIGMNQIWDSIGYIYIFTIFYMKVGLKDGEHFLFSCRKFNVLLRECYLSELGLIIPNMDSIEKACLTNNIYAYSVWMEPNSV